MTSDGIAPDTIGERWIRAYRAERASSPCPRPQERRSLRNFCRNRPEATNLNHHHAIRRVFICSPILNAQQIA